MIRSAPHRYIINDFVNADDNLSEKYVKRHLDITPALMTELTADFLALHRIYLMQ